MNRKGFTLIEVLAVIVILGMLLVFVAPNLLVAYENSKLKSEEIFARRISQISDTYIKLNSDMIEFNSYGTGQKSHDYTTGDTVEEVRYSVDIYKGVISVEDLINRNLIALNDYVNAGNKDVTCNARAEIEVYRDSDFVYCHKIKKTSFGCLTDKYKSSITGDYVIDTCTWEVTS